jgi:hypothetical protein
VVSEPHDSIEQEADRLGEAIVRRAAPPTSTDDDRGAGPSPSLPWLALPAAVTGSIRRALLLTGAPLESDVRGFFEPRLGWNLESIRIHSDDRAAAAARALRARAVTVGRHLLFAAREYAPRGASGRRLLAHELVHAIQQTTGRYVALARQPTPEIIDEELDPSGLRLRRGAGWAVVYIAATESAGEQRWATFRWDPQHEYPLRITFARKVVGNDLAYGLGIASDVEVDATLDRTLEDRRGDLSYTLFSYDFRFRGTLRIGDKVVRLPWRHRELYAPAPSRELPDIRLEPPSLDELDPLRDVPAPTTRPDQRQQEEEEERRQELIRGHPSFDSQAAMEAYIRDHPDESFVGITTSYGKFVARPVDEEELQRLAGALREDEASLPEVAWDAEQRQSAWGVTGIYQRGRAIDLDGLADLYYGDFLHAAAGRPDALEEAEIFRVGQHSFGRRPLTHDEVLARWRELDAYNARQVAALDSQPGRRFVALWVRGPAGFHEINESYFRGRDTYAGLLGRFNEREENLLDYLENGRQGQDVRHFLLAETDREIEDPTFRAGLAARETLAEAVGGFLYQEVERRAQQIALESIVGGRTALAPLAQDVERLRLFVLGFPDLSAERQREALQFIGVPERDRAFVQEVLSNREKATQLALGIAAHHTETIWRRDGEGGSVPDYEFYNVSLDILQGWIAETVEGLDQAAEQLRTSEVKALKLEGSLGDHVRTLTYRSMGFHTLQAADFPHDEGWKPAPLASGPLHLTTIGEQLYGNHANRRADEEFVWDVLKITAKVVLAVLAILVAQEAGLVVAGLLFAEGTAAFIATELIVSGVVFTALNEVTTLALEGHTASASVGEFVGHSVLNIATFGAFRALNTLLAAGARSFVAGRVGEAAFRASRGAQRAAEALRITGVGATFIGIGLGQRIASGQGIPQGRNMYLFLYENLLTLALLEGGAVLSRPLMERSGIWARSQRLGSLEAEVTGLRADIVRLQRDLSGLAVRPQAAPREAEGLVSRQRELLERQRTVVERLRESFRTRSDARALEAEATRELELIDTALAGVAQAEFLEAEQIMPVADSESVFTYRAGDGAVERFRQFYGDERVQVDAEGTIRVEVSGLATRELVFVPADRYAPAPSAPTPPVPAVVARQQALAARQEALLTQARRLGVSDPTLDAIRPLRPGQQTRTESLDATERLIDAAEKKAGGAMQRLRTRMLANLRRRLGADGVAQVRSGELADATDAELGDVVWFARGLRDLGVPQFRALLSAYRAGEPSINVQALLRTARAFSVAERNFALETFGQLVEARVPNARQLLADMSKSADDFAGGLWGMEYMRYTVGIENVARIEHRVPLGGSRAREYDVILRDGTHIELKNWRGWYEESLIKEFEDDVTILTSRLTNPDGLVRIRYVFRHPPPRSIENMRAWFRLRLENILTRADASPELRESMLRVFDRHADLVQSPPMQRSGGLPLPPVPAPQPSPALPGTDDDAEEDPDEAERGAPSP